jgi:hypothetical protein
LVAVDVLVVLTAIVTAIAIAIDTVTKAVQLWLLLLFLLYRVRPQLLLLLSPNRATVVYFAVLVVLNVTTTAIANVTKAVLLWLPLLFLLY